MAVYKRKVNCYFDNYFKKLYICYVKQNCLILLFDIL